jgi:hypothetical protein
LTATNNPIFSEKEIQIQKNIFEKWQKNIDFYFEKLLKIEEKEFDLYLNAGGNRAEFIPTDELKYRVQALTIAFHGRTVIQIKIRRMIEANISVFNGKTIEEALSQFKKEEDNIFWENTNISFYTEQFIAAVYGEKLKKEYDENLLELNNRLMKKIAYS